MSVERRVFGRVVFRSVVAHSQFSSMEKTSSRSLFFSFYFSSMFYFFFFFFFASRPPHLPPSVNHEVRIRSLFCSPARSLFLLTPFRLTTPLATPPLLIIILTPTLNRARCVLSPFPYFLFPFQPQNA
ncbi:hypothetical protein DFJ73DRAFT_531696 [Zopfochytrium polystomum]|nr:hypothetical protein DFJ73DRAFT_531696 [Zopfochytrium polystomum]